MWLLGMPMAVVWGLLAFLLNFIPFVGNIVTVVLVAAVSLVTFDSLWDAALPPLALIVLSAHREQHRDAARSSGAGWSSTRCRQLITVAFWTWLWGVPGAILAVPFLVVVKAVCDNVESLQILAQLPVGRPGAPRRTRRRRRPPPARRWRARRSGRRPRRARSSPRPRRRAASDVTPLRGRVDGTGGAGPARWTAAAAGCGQIRATADEGGAP